jgi:hypothetical protein
MQERNADSSRREGVKYQLAIRLVFWLFTGMDDREQIAALATDLQRVIDRYRAEFNLTLAATIGTLEVVKLELFRTESLHDDD